MRISKKVLLISSIFSALLLLINISPVFASSKHHKHSSDKGCSCECSREYNGCGGSYRNYSYGYYENPGYYRNRNNYYRSFQYDYGNSYGNYVPYYDERSRQDYYRSFQYDYGW